jgi:segregation and condensation protein B
MTDEQPPAFIPPNTGVALDETLRVVEAAVFASGKPVAARALAQLLPEWADVDALIEALRRRYTGRGIEVVEVAGGWQFRTAADLALHLRTIVEVPRRLPRAAMETLAIIAYHQPVTRPQIEELRGATLSQQTLDALLEAGLVAPAGRKETPGRPTLWATTDAFLTQFGLPSLGALPRREDLIVEPPGLQFDSPPPAEEGANDAEAPI